MSENEPQNPAEAFQIELLDDPTSNPFYSAAVATVAKVTPGQRFALTMPEADAEQITAALRLAANASGLRLYEATPKDYANAAGTIYKVWKLRANGEAKPTEGTPATEEAPKEAPKGKGKAEATEQAAEGGPDF